MSRRDARRHAFFLIFQFPFHNPFDGEDLREAYDSYVENLPAEEQPTGDDKAYLERVTAKAFGNQSEIDEEIEQFLKGWRLERINTVDLALLRLGVCELHYEKDIPSGATINEIVELAKIYGVDESPSFINGVLGGVFRALSPGMKAGEAVSAPVSVASSATSSAEAVPPVSASADTNQL